MNKLARDMALDLSRALMQSGAVDLESEAKHYFNDPLGHVKWCYPWAAGEGPDVWQADVLREIGEGTKTATTAIQEAVASGHGVGKTALVAWIIRWFLDTRYNPQVVVTANTKVQLESKTWRELAKWHQQAKTKDRFNYTATKYALKDRPETHFAIAIPWSKERSEAFAGTHEEHVLLVFDEASAIDDRIWEVAEGALTQPGAIWVVFGNPTRNTGRFRECFGRYKHRWNTRQVDSRSAKMANQEQLEQWVKDYGEDSDFARIRIKGQFPRASTNQFIPVDLVEHAMGKLYQRAEIQYHPRILGVDVARFGDNQTVMIKRQGLMAFDMVKHRELDTQDVAGVVARTINEWNPDAVFVDVGGLGAGVVDRLRKLGHDIIEVNAGSKPGDTNHYFNLRAEMWGLMKDWLQDGGAIPDDNELRDDLIGPEYGFDMNNRIQLEKKEDMRARGLSSPDCGDALALTFAAPVAAKRLPDPMAYVANQPAVAKMDYDLLGGGY